MIGINVGDIPKKDFLKKMIAKLGKRETIRRIAWWLSAKEEDVEKLVDQRLTGNYVDEQGVKGGDSFWGPL